LAPSSFGHDQKTKYFCLFAGILLRFFSIFEFVYGQSGFMVSNRGRGEFLTLPLRKQKMKHTRRYKDTKVFTAVLRGSCRVAELCVYYEKVAPMVNDF